MGEDKRYGKRIKPENIVASLPGVFVGQKELYEIVCSLLGPYSKGRIVGGEKLDNWMRLYYSRDIPPEREFSVYLRDVKFCLGDREYKIEESFENSHEYGEGGETRRYVFLLRSSCRVLGSHKFISYSVNSDDSCEYPTRTQKATYLLESDFFAKEVFGCLSGFGKVRA
ncbi:MAG: hypothetical protein AABX73_02330 [Nanoarchaeota archaeon]